MTYKAIIQGDEVFTYLDGKLKGVFDTDTFLSKVISPLEFSRFERNPDKKTFYIRKLEFNNYKLR